MYGVDTIQLASINDQITMMAAMKDACLRHSAPQSALDVCDSKLRNLYTKRASLLNVQLQPNYEWIERRTNAVEKILDALDPDQQENVNWWAQ